MKWLNKVKESEEKCPGRGREWMCKERKKERWQMTQCHVILFEKEKNCDIFYEIENHHYNSFEDFALFK